MARTLLLLLLLPAFALPAAGQELLTPGEQVLRGLRRALGQEDRARAVALLAEVGPLYRYPASPQEARALIDAAAAATRAKDTTVVVAAVRALGATGAPSAGPHVERFLRSAKPAAGQEAVMLAAVQASGRLRSETAIPALLKLAQASPDMTIADQAFLALGEFCRADTDLRQSVTGKVLAVCQSLSRRRARWNRLRAPGLRALQRLVGRRMNTVTQFSDWWKHAKTKKDPFG